MRASKSAEVYPWQTSVSCEINLCGMYRVDERSRTGRDQSGHKDKQLRLDLEVEKWYLIKTSYQS